MLNLTCHTSNITYPIPIYPIFWTYPHAPYHSHTPWFNHNSCSVFTTPKCAACANVDFAKSNSVNNKSATATNNPAYIIAKLIYVYFPLFMFLKYVYVPFKLTGIWSEWQFSFWLLAKRNSVWFFLIVDQMKFRLVHFNYWPDEIPFRSYIEGKLFVITIRFL